MNLPNKLTMVRMFLVPVIVALLLLCETGSACAARVSEYVERSLLMARYSRMAWAIG